VSEGIGAGLDWLGKTRGGVYAKGMFHYPSAGQFTVEGQMAGKYATEAKRAASAKAAKAVRQTVESMTDLQGAFQEAFGDSLGDVDQTKQMLDAAVQTAKETRAGGLPHVDFSLGQELPGVNVAAPLKDQMQDVTKAMLDKENSIYAQIAEKGGQAAHMVGDDTAPIGHGSRAWDMLGKEMGTCVHRKGEGETARYRLWTTNEDRYLTVPLTREQMREYLIISRVMRVRGDDRMVDDLLMVTDHRGTSSRFERREATEWDVERNHGDVYSPVDERDNPIEVSADGATVTIRTRWPEMPLSADYAVRLAAKLMVAAMKAGR
jgi:hypothetical protein